MMNKKILIRTLLLSQIFLVVFILNTASAYGECSSQQEEKCPGLAGKDANDLEKNLITMERETAQNCPCMFAEALSTIYPSVKFDLSQGSAKYFGSGILTNGDASIDLLKSYDVVITALPSGDFAISSTLPSAYVDLNGAQVSYNGANDIRFDRSGKITLPAGSKISGPGYSIAVEGISTVEMSNGFPSRILGNVEFTDTSNGNKIKMGSMIRNGVLKQGTGELTITRTGNGMSYNGKNAMIKTKDSVIFGYFEKAIFDGTNKLLSVNLGKPEGMGVIKTRGARISNIYGPLEVRSRNDYVLPKFDPMQSYCNIALTREKGLVMNAQGALEVYYNHQKIDIINGNYFAEPSQFDDDHPDAPLTINYKNYDLAKPNNYLGSAVIRVQDQVITAQENKKTVTIGAMPPEITQFLAKRAGSRTHGKTPKDVVDTITPNLLDIRNDKGLTLEEKISRVAVLSHFIFDNNIPPLTYDWGGDPTERIDNYYGTMNKGADCAGYVHFVLCAAGVPGFECYDKNIKAFNIGSKKETSDAMSKDYPSKGGRKIYQKGDTLDPNKVRPGDVIYVCCNADGNVRHVVVVIGVNPDSTWKIAESTPRSNDEQGNPGAGVNIRTVNPRDDLYLNQENIENIVRYDQKLITTVAKK